MEYSVDLQLRKCTCENNENFILEDTFEFNAFVFLVLILGVPALKLFSGLQWRRLIGYCVHSLFQLSHVAPLIYCDEKKCCILDIVHSFQLVTTHHFCAYDHF